MGESLYINLDFRTHEALNLTFHNSMSDPILFTAVNGQVYYKTSGDKGFYGYVEGTWRKFLTSIDAGNLDIAGDSGTGEVDLVAEPLNILGTVNKITTSAATNNITITIPTILKIEEDIIGGSAASHELWIDAGASTITIGGNTTKILIPGNLEVLGTTVTYDVETLTIEDPLLELARNNTADLLDIGIYGKYNSGTVKYSGFIRDASSTNKEWVLFADGTVANNVVSYSSLSDLHIKEIILGSPSSSVGEVGGIVLYHELNDYYTKIYNSSSQGENISYYLPTTIVDGGCLTTDASGNLTWSNVTVDIAYLYDILNNTHEPNGFIDRTSSTISFEDVSRTFTISPTGVTFSYYCNAEKFDSEEKQVVIDDTEGNWYFYFDGEDLLATQTWSSNFIYTKAYVAVIYWDSTNKKSLYFGDERHGIVMDGETHMYLHSINGAVWISGLALTDIVADGSGNLESEAQFGYSAGTIRDEDLVHSISIGVTPANICIFYRSGNNWRRKEADDYPLITTGTGRAAWNEYIGGNWQLTEVTNGKFVLYHYFSINDISLGLIGVIGQAEYDTLADAREAAYTEISSLYLDGITFEELVPIATVIFQTSGSYGNLVKSRVRKTDTGDDYIDWRRSKLSGVGSVSLEGQYWNRDVATEVVYLTTGTDNVVIGSLIDTSYKLEVTGNIGLSKGANRLIEVDVADSGVDGYNLTIKAGKGGLSAGVSAGGEIFLIGGEPGAGTSLFGGDVNIYGGGGVGVTPGGVKLGYVFDDGVSGVYLISILEDNVSTKVLVADSNGLIGFTSKTGLIGGYWDISGDDIYNTNVGNIILKGDLETDRWLNSDSNLFLGVLVVGNESLAHNSGEEGYRNVGLGYSALYSITTGSLNTAIGYNSLYALTEGVYNIGIGHGSFVTMTTAMGNVGVGCSTGAKITGGNNTFVGHCAGGGNTGGGATYNIGIGYYSISALTTGSHNIAIGSEAIFSNTTASYNVAVGYRSLYSNSTGERNVAIGASALYDNISGNESVAVGYEALTNATDGKNIAIGYRTADNLITGTNNIYIGYDINASSTNVSYELIIDNLIFGDLLNGYMGICIAPDPNYTLSIDGSVNLTSGNAYYIDGVPIGGAGVDEFVDLLDVPNSYTGYGGYGLRVTSGEDGLEFYVVEASLWSVNGATIYRNSNVGIGDFSITPPSTKFQILDNSKYIKFSHNGTEALISGEGYLQLAASTAIGLTLSTTLVTSSLDFSVDLSKIYYLGNNTTDGSWRWYNDGNGDLIFEKRVSGTWTYSGKFSITA